MNAAINLTGENVKDCMELEGRFTSAENLAEVIRNLAAERQSGTLVLRCTNSYTHFQFHHGMLSGSGNPDRPRRLGQILLNRGLIDRAGLEEALAYQADFAPGTPIGRVLMHRGRLTNNELRDAVRLQIEEEIWDLLLHCDGFYQFKQESADAEDPLVEIAPDPLVNDVLSRREEWNRIRQQVSNDNMVPAVVKLSGSSDRETLHLTSHEWHILSLINGYYDVGCIAARSGLGRFETYRIISSFLSTGLIELRVSQEPALAHFSEEHQEADGANGSVQSGAGSTSSSRWSGVLARLREESDNPAMPAAGRLQFESPVTFLVAICNQVMAQLMLNQDFIVDPSDERLAERYWRQILMSYPRADLVSASDNIFTAESFDRYTRTLGVEGPMKSIFLETVEALNRYLRTLYLLSAQRLGSRTARSLFLNIMDDMRQRSTISNSDSFFFKEATAKVLE